MVNPQIVDTLIDTMFRVTRDVDVLDDILMVPLRLTRARWVVLEQAAKMQGEGTAGAIATKLDLSRPAVQRLLNELVLEGFLEVRRGTRRTDARQVSLTERGIDVYTQASLRYGHWRAWIGRDFSYQELEGATALLKRMLNRFDEADEWRLSEGRYD